MYIKSLFLIVCLLASTFLGANNGPVNSITSEATILEDGGCNLPAPFNFHIEALGSTWVTFGWGGNATAQHRIRIFRESDNALLSTTTVPIGTATATINIPYNTYVRAEINAICSNGEQSPNTATIGNIKGIIVDLVVNGYNGPGGSTSCYIVGSGTCNVRDTPFSTFKVSLRNAQHVEQFSQNYDVLPMTEPPYRFKLYPQNPNSGDDNTFSFFCNPNQGPNCDNSSITINVRTGGVVYDGGTVYFSRVLNGFLYLNKITANTNINVGNNGSYVRIDNLSPAFGPDPGVTRDQNGASTDPIALVSPNPFAEVLEVHLSETPTADLSLQLFNLNGQKVYDQLFSGGQEQYAVPTAGLQPGFYLLRIETGGAVQTMKVIKE